MKKLTIILILFFKTFGSFGQQFIEVSDSAVVVPSTTSLDSLFQNYFSSLRLDKPSIDSINVGDSIRNKVDTLKRKFLDFDLTGQIGAGYSFGLLTGYIDSSSTSPLHVLNSKADMELTYLGIPMNVGYNYSTFRNPLGVNNYFRVSVNMDKYKQLQGMKRDALKTELDKKITETTQSKDKLKGKLGYSELLQQRLRSELEKKKLELEKEVLDVERYKQAGTDSLLSYKENGKSALSDSLSGQTAKTDSLRTSYEMKKAEFNKYALLYDSLQRTYVRIMDTYQQLNQTINQYKEKKDYIHNYSSNGIKSLGDNCLKNVTKLDFGLTYPSTTSLTKNSVPIKGIDFESQKGNWYTAVTAGVTLNNLMVTNDAIQNKLFYTKNLFNQFDFQSIRQKRFIVQTKTGWGTKDATHIFLGLRYTNKAVIPGMVEDDTINSVYPSVGFEIDGRIKPKFLPGTTLDLVYGKTSNTSLGADSTISNPLGSLFSNDRTHTALAKITQPLNEIRTQVTASIRWIDPLADMASLGVLQPNNLRYEITTKHTLLQNLDAGLNYRIDRNNLDNTLDSTMHLRILGGNLSGQIGKVLSYYGNLNFLTMFNERQQEMLRTNSNYMLTLGITGKYKLAGYENAVSLIYSDYKLTTLFDEGNYRNYGLQHLTKLNHGQNSFSINVFESNQVDSSFNRSVIIGDDWSLQKDRFQLTLGVKISNSKKYGNDLGGKIEIKTLLTDQLQWILKAEKFILGDFYNNYDPLRFQKFPFAITTQLNYNLK